MRFVAMTEDQAKWIAYQWQYKGAYSFFHDEKNSRTTSFLEFGKKNTWQYAVYRESEIIGFIGVKRINGMIEMAPGLNLRRLVRVRESICSEMCRLLEDGNKSRDNMCVNGW
ncbi:ribosomal-protein-alanine acetyltransferase [Bacillus sp. JCM 19047]|nr:ribosomal-protein-alanine acetyltransferase [Bacillus sp. JCM 19047]